MRSKTVSLKIQILATVILLTAVLLCVINTKTLESPPSFQAPIKRIHEKTIARDLKIDDYSWGRKTFSMQIEKLRVVKKKLGFLRLGFIKIARVEGVTLDWYEGNNSNGTQFAKGTEESANLINSNRFSNQINKLKQSLPGNIKGVELHRVKINFFRNGKIASSIIADSATFNGYGMRIVFKGNVKLQNGSGKKLKCDKISWLIDEKSFASTKHFVFEDGYQKIQGKGFRTDFELNEVITQDKGK